MPDGRILAVSAAGFLLVGIAWIQFSRLPSIVEILPEQQGVLVSNSQVIGLLGPGRHPYDASTQDVYVYSTLVQHSYALPEPVLVAGCPSEVNFVWQIEDVEAWHFSNKNIDTVGPQLAAEVQRLALTSTSFGEDPRTEMQVFVNKSTREFFVDGAAIAFVRFGELLCQN